MERSKALVFALLGLLAACCGTQKRSGEGMELPPPPPAAAPAPPAPAPAPPAQTQAGPAAPAAAPAPPSSAPGPGTAEPTEYVSLDVRDADLADVLKAISRQVGVNIIADPEVKEKVTVELDRVAWRDALSVIARLAKCKVVDESDRLIRFTQPPSITMEFHDADIKVVLELLAKQAGVNIVYGSDLKGTVSLSLRDVPWMEALQAV